MTEPVKKLFDIPRAVRSLLGEGKAYIVMSTEGSDRFGYYTSREGKIVNNRIPDYAYKEGYTNKTDEYLSTPQGQKDAEKQKSKRARQTQTSENGESADGGSATGVISGGDAAGGYILDATNVQAFLEAEPMVEQTVPEGVSTVDSQWFSWKGFKETMGKISAGFKFFTEYFQKCAADAGSDAWSKRVSAITLQPIMTRTFEANTRLNKMFRNAGIEGDPAEWLKTHGETAQGKLVRRKMDQMLGGSSAGMDNLKADMYAVVKERNPEAQENGEFVDSIIWDRDAYDALRNRLFQRAKILSEKLKEDPTNVQLSAEYMIYFNAIEGLDIGQTNLKKYLMQKHNDQIFRQALREQGRSPEDIEDTVESMKVLAESYGMKWDISAVVVTDEDKANATSDVKQEKDREWKPKVFPEKKEEKPAETETPSPATRGSRVSGRRPSRKSASRLKVSDTEF